MAELLKDIVWRVATPADHDAILRLDPGGGAYDVGDYLPERLNDYLTDPQTVCSIGVLGDKVVTFALFTLVDEGQTLLGRAARSDKNFRGAGVWKEARYHSAIDARERFAAQNDKLKYMIGCTSGFSSKMATAFGNTHLDLVRYYFHLNVDVLAATSCFVRHSDEVGLIRALEPNECMRMMCDPRIRWKLFPNSLVIIGREPFRLMQGNFERMFKYCKSIYGTFVPGDEDVENLQTLSFGGGFRFKDRYVYEVDVYSSAHCDLDVVRHVSAHIPTALKLAADAKLTMTVFCTMNTAMDKVIRNLLEGIRGVKLSGKLATHYCTVNPEERYMEASRRLAGKL